MVFLVGRDLDRMRDLDRVSAPRQHGIVGDWSSRHRGVTRLIEVLGQAEAGHGDDETHRRLAVRIRCAAEG